MAQYTKSQLVSASNATYFTNTSGGISASAVRDLNDSWISSSALLSGSNTFIGNQIISGSLTAQLQANYIWLGNSSGYNQAVATSSISLQGAQGIQGLQGTQGTQGIQGIQGLQGLQGLQGIQGLQGTQGIQGITGLQGIQGIQGASGSQGIQGLQGTQGLQGLQGIQGVSGSQGTQGLQGIQGADNSTQGTQGLQGIQGLQGLQGIQGISGSNGATGSQGIQGLQGLQGIQGADNSTQGTQGIQGLQGLQGIQGITGISGSNGAQGIQGIQGIQGADNSTQGTQGTQGVQGFTGAQGIQGITGLQGIQGITGLSGSNGAQGAQGIQGVQGTDNSTQGAQGAQGIAGSSGSGSADTGSLLVTASFANNNITFTKGDASQFSLQGFATTGSNTFNGTQNISGSIVMNSANDSEKFLIYRNGQPTQNWEFGITSPGNSFLKTRNRTWVQNDGVDGELMIHYLPTKFENGIYTQGSQLSITGSVVIAGNLTASLQQGYAWVGNSGGVSSLVATSSFGTSINTGSFATTGSNSFNGNQTITGSLTISSSAPTDLTVVGQIFVSSSATGTNSAPKITVSGSQGTTTINRNSISTRNLTTIAELNPIATFAANLTTYDEIGFTLDPTGSGVTGWTTGPTIYINNTALDTYPAVFGFQNKANLTDGRVAVLTPLSASAGFTASLQNGYAWVGNSLGQNTQVATSSFGGGSTNTGSLMITGSVSGNVLTFTKGDASTFSLTVATGSGGSGSTDTGSLLVTASFNTTTRDITFTKGDASTFKLGAFAITGSNTFNANQTITTAGNTQLNIISTGGGQANLEFQAPNANLQAYGDLNINNNGQYGGSGSIKMVVKDNQMILAASQGFQMGVVNAGGNGIEGGNITINVPSGSQKLQLTGSLAVSNTFTASLQQGYAWVGNASGVSSLVATSSFGGGVNTGSLLVTASFDNTTRDITFTKGDATTFKLGGFATTGSNTFTGKQTMPALDMSGSITFPNGAVIGPNSVGQSTVISSLTALQISSSVNSTYTAQTLTLTSSTSTNINSATVNTLTAPRTDIRGVETIGDMSGTGAGEVYLLGRSGSLIIGNSTSTATYAGLSHLSSSQQNSNTNLIFKTNSNTGDTIISGSNNLFVNPAAQTAGFKRYIGGNGNIMLNNNNVPQITGSMAFSPTMNNNYFGGNATTMIIRGPASSSLYAISANSVLGTINIGTTAAVTAEKIVSGLTMTGNNIAGTLSIVANQSALSSSVSFLNNIVAGTANLTLSSSAVNMSNNIINDSNFVFTNQYYTGSVGQGSVAMNRNTIGGQSNLITISGSLPVGGVASNSISDNFIFGGANTIYIDVQNARLSGSAVYKNVIRTGLMGNNLIVSGSSLLNDASSHGSVFVGRYNADDNRRNKTSDTVFAVGTGNTTTRKTGFLIDSGSNSYFEGTLNVSGSTTHNGNTEMTGSLVVSSFTTLASVSSSLNFADDTAAAAGGVPLGGLYRNGNFVMIRLT